MHPISLRGVNDNVDEIIRCLQSSKSILSFKETEIHTDISKCIISANENGKNYIYFLFNLTSKNKFKMLNVIKVTIVHMTKFIDIYLLVKICFKIAKFDNDKNIIIIL